MLTRTVSGYSFDAPEGSKAQTFGSKIFLLRRRSGRSQSALAALAGMSNGYLADIENGRRPAPPRKTVMRIASALDLSSEQCDRLFAIAEAERYSALHDANLPIAIRKLLISIRVAAPSLGDETIGAINALIKTVEQKVPN